MNQPERHLLRVAILILAVAASGCTGGAQSERKISVAAPDALPAVVVINGTDGAQFHGFYVADGVRTAISGRVPLKLNIPGISQIALAKGNINDNLTIQARYENGSGQMSTPPGRADAILVVVQSGFTGSYLSAEKLTAMAQNSVIVIKPYWFEGTWVFDDENVGLHREPFIAGVPDMINEVVKDIPNARSGFRLTASAQEFPGYQKKLIWNRADRGGNFYRLENPQMEGWLCPAMFRYFARTPKAIFVRVDEIKS